MALKFNAFDFITPAIEDTKKFLRPLGFRKWLKMGLISFMSAGVGGGGGSGMRVPNIPSGGGSRSGSSAAAGNATAKTAAAMSTISGLMYLIIPAIILLFGVMIIWSYITSVFSFVFVECLETHKVHIRKPFARNKKLGLSLFFFRLLTGLVILCMIAIVVLPIVGLIFAGKANSAAIVGLVLSLLLLIFVFFIVMLVVSIFLALVYNYAFLHMYFARMKMWPSIRATFSRIRQNLLEVIVYLLSKMVVGIAFGLAGFVALLAVGLVLAVPFVPIGFGLYYAGVALAWSPAIITVIVLVALVALVIFGYLMNTVMLPFSSFGIYFSIRNYDALMKR